MNISLFLQNVVGDIKKARESAPEGVTIGMPDKIEFSLELDTEMNVQSATADQSSLMPSLKGVLHLPNAQGDGRRDKTPPRQ